MTGLGDPRHRERSARPSGGVPASAFMRPQDWAGFALLVAGAGVVWALVTARWWLALVLGGVVVAADLTGRLLSRRYPSPFRARFRFVLVHPARDRRRLCGVMDPRPGERILEIGPGAGHHAVDVARRLPPGGRLDVLDLQPEMLDAVKQRARRHQVDNITATVADACERLPYPDDTFDAAYLIGVLGELPSPDGTLQELHRVLKPDSRLVVGETFLDPDFVRSATLQRRTDAAGFVFERRFGTPAAYLARFRAG